MIFHLTKAWKKFRITYNVKNLSGIELNTIVNNERLLNSTDTLDLSFIMSDTDTDIANEYFTDLMSHLKTDLTQN